MQHQEVTDKNKLIYGKNIHYPEDTLDPNVKKKDDYGLQYAKAMYADFTNGRASLFYQYRAQMQENRDFAAGLQNTDEFKRRLSDDDQDESYLNIDWRIVTIPSRFIDATVGKMIEYDNPITLTAIDSISQDKKRESYWKRHAQIKNKEFISQVEEVAGAKMTAPTDGDEPQTIEELDLYDALGNFKMKEEIAMEQAMSLLMFEKNNWREKEKQLKRGSIVDGLFGTKVTTLANGFPTVRVCDAINLILPFSKYYDFRDAAHIGEVIPYTLAELRKLAGNKLSEDDYKDVAQKFCKRFGNNIMWDEGLWLTIGRTGTVGSIYDTLAIPVMDFEITTVDSAVYKKTVNQSGNMNYFKADYNYDPENGNKDSKNKRSKVGIEYEITYSGCWILDTDFIIGWGCNHNVPRDPGNLYKCYKEYTVYAPDMQGGIITSKAERMLPFGSAIQLSWLKMQALKANAAPKGYAIEVSGLIDVPMGAKGQVITPLQIIKMHRQTGVLAWSRKDMRGDSSGYKPIEPMENGIGTQAQEYINDINFNVEMIRSVTGINENSDASTPNPNQPVYTAKLALMATNNALATVYDGYKYVKLGTARSLMDKIQVLAKYGRLNDLLTALGEATMQIIKIGADLAFSQYGIVVDDLPSDQDRQWLDKMIETALAQRTNTTHTGGIELEDAMIIRSIQNVKLAWRMLIVRRKRREHLDMIQKQNDIKMNGQVQQESATKANILQMQRDTQAHAFKMDEIHLSKSYDYVIMELNKGSIKDDLKYKTDSDFITNLLQQEHESSQNDAQRQADIETAAAKPAPATV